MECYTSDSCDSDSREQKTLDLSSQLLDSEAVEAKIEGIIDEKKCEDKYEIMLLYNNLLVTLPELVNKFDNLKILDISNNRLTILPDVLEKLPLTSLIAKNNELTNESLPKCFTENDTLRELNLSGNRFKNFPEQVFELASLKYLYLAGNRISNIPKHINKLKSLTMLSLSGNRITEVPDTMGELRQLQGLVLSGNELVRLPASIANLDQLRSLMLHNNRLKTLPTEIVKLRYLSELSLRDNPLVVRFVKDMTLQPASLMELAGRTIKLHDVPFAPGDLPATLLQYLESAHRCVNAKCRGVFFDSRVEHIKFVDFCGKYRIPLMQYLCSSKCVTGSWESRETEYHSRNHMIRKVLLG